jgi:hypothetical protein
MNFKLISPLKMPSEPSLYLFLLIKDLVTAMKNLRLLTFEAEYPLTVDQLRKVINGGAIPQNERLTSMTLEYLGCNYDIGDKLELQAFVMNKYPWITLKI